MFSRAFSFQAFVDSSLRLDWHCGLFAMKLLLKRDEEPL